MKLIDKDAVLAETTKIYDRIRSNGYIDVCDDIDDILSFIDTLEVKEVDLCKEEERIWKDFNMGECHLSKNDLENIAKHFFELGMRVNNPITAADRGTAEEIIINLKRVEKDYRIDLTKEITWVRNKVKKGE